MKTTLLLGFLGTLALGCSSKPPVFEHRGPASVETWSSVIVEYKCEKNNKRGLCNVDSFQILPTGAYVIPKTGETNSLSQEVVGSVFGAVNTLVSKGNLAEAKQECRPMTMPKGMSVERVSVALPKNGPTVVVLEKNNINGLCFRGDEDAVGRLRLGLLRAFDGRRPASKR